VQQAKVALGERGEAWWEPSTDTGRAARVDATVLALSTHRSPDKTICPSDAARTIGGDDWRGLMPLVRERLRALAQQGLIDVLQRGEPVNANDVWRGPIRARRRSV
jgi:hypothetical protein